MSDVPKIKELLNRIKHYIEREKRLKKSEDIVYYFKAKRDDDNKMINHHKNNKTKVRYKI